MKKIIIFLTLFLSLTTQSFAEKRYVTDRILLGIHTKADATSTLVKSVPSGTEFEVLDSSEDFLYVELDDGTVGWVNSGFVMEETPTTRKYDVLAHQYEQTTQELDKLKIDYAKKNREVQIRRDQVSNAKTTIQELKKRQDGSVVVDLEMESKLNISLQEVGKLKDEISRLKKLPKPVVNIDYKKSLDELTNIKTQNDIMQQRIDVALAHLNGERIPTAEELASIRPKFPRWYWTLLTIILLAGIIMGYFIMDYRMRRKSVV